MKNISSSFKFVFGFEERVKYQSLPITNNWCARHEVILRPKPRCLRPIEGIYFKILCDIFCYPDLFKNRSLIFLLEGNFALYNCCIFNHTIGIVFHLNTVCYTSLWFKWISNLLTLLNTFESSLIKYKWRYKTEKQWIEYDFRTKY